LSWSLIGPIQRIDARLAGIASGDFSGHVDVENRDELGALAANVNRMNDELRRLYTGSKQPAGTSRVPGQHVARAADAAERDHRLLAGAARRMFGPVNEAGEYLDDILSSGTICSR
jgi:methyl-accepting chemotaxis protein